MRHMVVYRSMDGGPSYHETDDLEGAIGTVEHLRNTQNIMDARIFSLQEVPISFRAYYRVEVVAPEPPTVEAAPFEVVEAEPVPVAQAEPALDGPPMPEETPVAHEPEFAPPTPVLPSASSRFGLFSRG
jgi:hypothetical protein